MQCGAEGRRACGRLGHEARGVRTTLRADHGPGACPERRTDRAVPVLSSAATTGSASCRPSPPKTSASTGRPPTAKCMPSIGCRSRSTKARSTCCSARRAAASRRRFASSPASSRRTAGASSSPAATSRALPPSQRNIAMVFQSYALFPHLPVSENIVFGLKVRKVAPADVARRLDAGRRPARAFRPPRPQAVAALRRPAAARRARPRDHRRGAGVPDGRAAVESRCAAAAGHARRDPPAAAAARHHDGLRDARPGRGDVDGRSRRAAQSRADRAERDTRRALRAARQHVRRALHRHAADEPAAARSAAPEARWSPAPTARPSRRPTAPG